MQEHNMVILSQAETEVSGVCRDYTGVTLMGEERVQALLKNWEQLVVFRVDGQPWWSTALIPFKGSSNTLSPFVVLT